MPIHFTTSHSLQALCDALCDELKNQPASVFAPWVMVTQTEGMNNWLRQQMAACMGIAANYQFYQPNRLLSQLFFWADGRYDDEVLSHYHLVWLLYDLLSPDGEFSRRFPLVAAYYQGQSGELKQASLASTLADLFDQYQVYRSDMVARWRKNELLETGNSTEQWQQWLWYRAYQLTKDKLPDKSVVASILLQKLKVPAIQENLRRRIPRIHLFGLSVLTQWHIKILHELGKVVDLYFYLLNPAPEIFWMTDKSRQFINRMEASYTEGEQPVNEGNALLTGMGGLLQNTFGMLFRYDVFLNDYNIVGAPPPEPQNLLQALQWDVYNNAVDNRIPLTPAMLKDGSVVVVNAYTRVREIEVLYNHILHLKTTGHLHSRDVVVMVTSIDEYAPYISAVFDNAPYQMAYRIADANPAQDNTWMGALHTLLQLNEDSFSAEEVLGLLDYKVLRDYFDLHNLSLLRHYLRQSGIRGGMEGEEQYETHLLSWKHGLQRLLFGVCMAGEPWVETPAGTGFHPADLAEGQSAETIVRLCQLVDWLMEMLTRRRGYKTVSEWIEVVKELVTTLQPQEGEEEEAGEELQQSLKQMMDLLESLEPAGVQGLETFKAKVSWAVFGEQLLGEIDRVQAKHRFGRGGITFCSLIPMRSIPFSMVAMLGLDAAAYPRKDRRPEYDLMRKRRLGDRSLRDNDRHLFLENLMAAKTCFYLSYVGQSTKDGSIINPSPVVEELLDYVAAGLQEKNGEALVREMLVQNHPLHNFSSRYNSSATGWHNWLHTKPQTAVTNLYRTNTASSSPVPVQVSAGSVSLKQLHALLGNAPRLFFSQRLHIRYENEETLLPDWEMTVPDKLQQFALRSRLHNVKENDRKRLVQKLKEKGELPLAQAGEFWVARLSDESDAAESIVPGELQGVAETAVFVEVALPSGALIEGEVGGLRNGMPVRKIHSKNPFKHLLSAALDMLLLAASDHKGKMQLVLAQTNTLSSLDFPSAGEALELLETLTGLYQQALTQLNGFSTQFFHDKNLTAFQSGEMTLAQLTEAAFDNSFYPLEDRYLLAAYQDGYYEEESAGLVSMEALLDWALKAFEACKINISQ